MTLLQAFRAYGWVSASLVLVTLSGVFLLERGGEPAFTASGTIMIARPEVDPSRVASRAVNLAGAIASASTTEARERNADDGGRADYRIIQVNENRAQVLASGDGAVPGVRAVLRSLSDNVAEQQLAADVEPEERIRPRLFVQIPEDEVEALGAIDGNVSGDPPEVVGTLVLEDPFAGAENPLGGTATATRLVMVAIDSDEGTQTVQDSLPAGATFRVSSNDRSARQILSITTSGRAPADALTAFDIVTEAVEAELDRRQELAEAPTDARLIVDMIAAPLAAVEVDDGLSVPALMLLAVGLGGAVAVPTILRELRQDRGRKRPTSDGGDSGPPREAPGGSRPRPVRSGAPSR